MTEPILEQHETVSRANVAFRCIAGFTSGIAGMYSARSPFKQSDNEDAAALIPIDVTRGILAVADGVGGQPGGAAAAEVALASLLEVVETIRKGDVAFRDCIMGAIEQANRSIMEIGIGSATTLAVVEIEGDTIRPYHVGDSMILVVGQRGKRLHQTVPHSPVGYAIEAGLLDENEAIHHEDRHVVSNVLGTPNMRIEVGSVIQLKPHDTVLLASDGIFDNLHVEEVVETIRKGPMPQVVDHLAEQARTRMRSTLANVPSKPDDKTFIVYRSTLSVSAFRDGSQDSHEDEN